MRVKWVFLSIAVCCFILNPQSAKAQQDFSKVEIKVTPVAGHVYMLEGAGGNIGVSAGPDGILIIDDQFAPLAEKIRTALSGLNPGKLKFVLNTHWHGDHTGSNKVFGREATIIAHENVRKRLMSEQQLLGRAVSPEPQEAWPVITFDESLSVHFNGEEIKVIHFPHGHTDGDSVVFFTNANVIHMGDHYFSGWFPFVDLNTGGDVEGLIRNIELVIDQVPSNVKIIPGHGPLSTLADLKKYHEMLIGTTSHIRQRMEAGKTLDDIKAEGLPSQWQSWATDFIPASRWIEIVYRSFSRTKDLGPKAHH